MSILLFACWALLSVLFVGRRSRELRRRTGESDLLNDTATSLFVRGTALALLIILLLVC